LAPITSDTLITPCHDCRKCPRLVEFRRTNRKLEPLWHNAPVESIGPLTARLLVIGLAPGKKGANRTGRPFTGDYAGQLLFPTLIKFGFALGTYAPTQTGNLKLKDCRITNAVRCVPPQNKPIGAEISSCLPFLKSEIDAMKNLRVVLVLGGIAHYAVIRAFKMKTSKHKFNHGSQHKVDAKITLFDSYHCSRLNTNTGRLTDDMFSKVFKDLRKSLNDDKSLKQ